MSSRTRTQVLGLVALLALALNVGPWVRIATAPAFEIGSLLHDDGYYYIVVAENILSGRGATFDGINPTSGFQPLYQGISIALVALAQWTGISIFRLIFFASLLFVAWATVPLMMLTSYGQGVAHQRVSMLFMAIALPLNFALVFKRLGTGMEMALALVLLSHWALIMVGLPARSESFRQRLVEGFLVGLLVLTRIDYAVFALILGIFVIAIWGRQCLRPLVPLGIGMAVPVTAYVLLAFVTLESIIPVSFLAKQYYVSLQITGLSILDRIKLMGSNLAQIWVYPLGYSLFGYLWQWGMVGLGAALALMATWATTIIFGLRSRLPRFDWRSPWLWLAGAVCVHSTSMAWSGAHFIGPAYFWYYTPELMALIAGLGWLFVRAIDLTPKYQLLGVVPLLLWIGSTFLYNLDDDVASYAPYRLAIEQARALTPENARVGSWDAGYNAYWLRPRTVINLDGMVNSRRYLTDIIQTNQYGEYIREMRIEYILNMAHNTPEALASIREQYFRDPSIPRSCYDIRMETAFVRQNLVIFLIELTCPSR